MQDPAPALDPAVRLIPALRSTGGGQAGFRNALKTASGNLGVDGAEDSFTAHDFRKSLSTDLGWRDDMSELLQRRILGHRAGDDVYATTYLLDSREVADLMPAAIAIEEAIASSIGTLLVPTTKRPAFGSATGEARRRRIDAVLAEAGIHIDIADGRLDSRGPAAANVSALVDPAAAVADWRARSMTLAAAGELSCRG